MLFCHLCSVTATTPGRHYPRSCPPARVRERPPTGAHRGSSRRMFLGRIMHKASCFSQESSFFYQMLHVYHLLPLTWSLISWHLSQSSHPHLIWPPSHTLWPHTTHFISTGTFIHLSHDILMPPYNNTHITLGHSLNASLHPTYMYMACIYVPYLCI